MRPVRRNGRREDFSPPSAILRRFCGSFRTKPVSKSIYVVAIDITRISNHVYRLKANDLYFRRGILFHIMQPPFRQFVWAAI